MKRRCSPGLGFGVIGLGSSLPAADTAVNVALPAIAQAFDLDTVAIRWTVIAYVLVYASLMILMGHWGDQRGHWRVFRWGLWVGLIAYALCGFAPSYSWLLAGRGLQGVSTALLLAVGPALAVEVLGVSNRAQALALYGAIGAGAAALAPLLAGWAIAASDWSAAFLGRLPLALLALAILARWGTPDGPGNAAQKASDRDARGDWQGTKQHPEKLSTLAASFKAHRAPPLRGLHLLHAWAQACGFTSMLLLPFLLADRLRLDAFHVGALLGCWPLGLALGNLYAPRRVSARGLPASMHFGLGTLALGCCALALATLAAAGHWGEARDLWGFQWILGCGLLIQGVGLGLVQMTYTTQVLTLTPPGQEGLGGAATLSSRTLGVLFAALSWPWLLDLARAKGLAWSLGLAWLYALGAVSLAMLILWRRADAESKRPLRA